MRYMLKSISCGLALFFLGSASTCFALNFDALLQENKTPAQISSSLNQRITKEVFFAVLGKRFASYKANSLLYRLKTLDISQHNTCFLTFDGGGNLLNTGNLDEDCAQESNIKFDFKTVFLSLLKNSYGYQPAEKKEADNEVMIAAGIQEFDELQKALHSYYRLLRSEDLAREYLDRVAAILQKWKKHSTAAGQTAKADPITPGMARALLLFAADYDKFLEQLSNNNYF